MTDQDIVNLYWQRSERAIPETAGNYGTYCHTVAYNLLRNTEDAEESVNDTWLAAWNAMPPSRPNSLKAFLGKLTRNIAQGRPQQVEKYCGQTIIAYNATTRGGPSLY